MWEFFKSGWVQRWLWLCPALGIAVATAVLVVFGFSWRTALLAALLLACPALLLWGGVMLVRELRRQRAPKNDDPDP